MRTVRIIGEAQKKGLGAQGVVLMQLNGEAAGQTVPHFHIHVIPGSIADLGRPHATHMADQIQLKELANRIIGAMAN